MIGKVGLSRSAGPSLAYCYYEKAQPEQGPSLQTPQVRGEVAYVQHLALRSLPNGDFDIPHLARQFRDNQDKNRRITNPIWHQSFSFPPGERPTQEQVERITTAFAREFGFVDNQMVAFRHHDRAHSHFHIVANRIDYNGRTTAWPYLSHLRTGRFCRQMEQELGLMPAPAMRLRAKRDGKYMPQSATLGELRERIDALLPRVDSLEQLSQALREQGYKTYANRGIAFIKADSGMKIKGSELGPEYTRTNLEKRVGQIPLPEPRRGLWDDHALDFPARRGLRMG